MSVPDDRVLALSEALADEAIAEGWKAHFARRPDKIAEFKIKEKQLLKCAKRVLGLIEPGETG